MKAERTRLARLKRLEKLRAIARQSALADAAGAEAALARLTQLATRTATLIDGYGARSDAACGDDLARQRIYLGELHRMATRTDADVVRARDHADVRAAQAAAAERSRAAVEGRAHAAQARITRAQSAASVPLGARPVPKT